MSVVPSKSLLEQVFLHTEHGHRIGKNITAHRTLQTQARRMIWRNRHRAALAAVLLLQGCIQRRLVFAYISATVKFAKMKNMSHHSLPKEIEAALLRRVNSSSLVTFSKYGFFLQPASLDEDVVHSDAILSRAYDIMLVERDARIQKNVMQRRTKTAPASISSHLFLGDKLLTPGASSFSSLRDQRSDGVGDLHSSSADAKSSKSSFPQRRIHTVQGQRKRITAKKKEDEPIAISETVLRSLPRALGTKILKQNEKLKTMMGTLSPTKNVRSSLHYFIFL